MAEKYDDVLLPFLALMRKELHANSRKGDRPGWLSLSPDALLLEVYWHTAKLSAAVKNNDGPAIMEHSADVANMAMMVLDVCGGLAFTPAAGWCTSCGCGNDAAGYTHAPLCQRPPGVATPVAVHHPGTSCRVQNEAGQCGCPWGQCVRNAGVAAVAPTDDEAQSWAWEQVRREVGTEGWTGGDASNFFGFFCWGWLYRGQLEKQRAAGVPASGHQEDGAR